MTSGFYCKKKKFIVLQFINQSYLILINDYLKSSLEFSKNNTGHLPALSLEIQLLYPHEMGSSLFLSQIEPTESGCDCSNRSEMGNNIFKQSNGANIDLGNIHKKKKNLTILIEYFFFHLQPNIPLKNLQSLIFLTFWKLKKKLLHVVKQ